MLTSLPNLLTLSRIGAIPAIVAAFYLETTAAHWVTFGLFLVAGVTDFLDGHLARRWSQMSALGRFLDPVADKLIVAAAILMMVNAGWINGALVLAAMVILLREILVSGLREFLGQVQIQLPVSQLGKWKTTLQMIALAALLLGDAAEPVPVAWAGAIALWLAAGLTLYTGYDYLRAGLRHIRTQSSSPAE
ncbi:MAG: CDP-diacylglycerol--glycerol-3-phosphate 3-phosphatidyltransferase [Alphaproteobacteria bacterium]|nr:CDP-diacylglycerol--glycerol-3-phosphate 3-phosphatidyltransferase [Alphaproteobacteria bacterium]